MIPWDDDLKRRKINLGGVSSASSHSTIIDQAKARRLERLDVKRRNDSAIAIQAWWKRTREARAVRRQLQAAFDLGSDDPIMWTRYLVFGGVTEDRLGRWSVTMVSDINSELQ